MVFQRSFKGILKTLGKFLGVFSECFNKVKRVFKVLNKVSRVFQGNLKGALSMLNWCLRKFWRGV